MRLFIITCMIMHSLALNLTFAQEPYSPDISLSNISISEPPPLPEIYGIELPFLDNQPPPRSQSLMLPGRPFMMELCAITGNPKKTYPTSAELIQGCYRGDAGLSYFILEPYRYWKTLTQPNIPLTPKNIVALYPSIVVNYFDSNRIIMGNIQIGISGQFSYIAINGNVFEQEANILASMYKLVNDAYEESY